MAKSKVEVISKVQLPVPLQVRCFKMFSYAVGSSFEARISGLFPSHRVGCVLASTKICRLCERLLDRHRRLRLV